MKLRHSLIDVNLNLFSSHCYINDFYPHIRYVLYFRLALAENLESFKIIRIRFVIKAITSNTVTVPGSLLDAYARKSAVLTVEDKNAVFRIRIGSGFN